MAGPAVHIWERNTRVAGAWTCVWTCVEHLSSCETGKGYLCELLRVGAGDIWPWSLAGGSVSELVTTHGLPVTRGFSNQLCSVHPGRIGHWSGSSPRAAVHIEQGSWVLRLLRLSVQTSELVSEF